MLKLFSLLDAAPPQMKQVPLADQIEFMTSIRESIIATRVIATKQKGPQHVIDLCNRDLVVCDSVLNMLKSQKTVA